MEQPKNKNNGYYRLLTRKMILTIIIVSLTPMILVGSFILYQFRISYHEKLQAHLKELVLKQKQNIDSFLKEKLGDIRFLAETFCCEELSDESFLRDRLAMLQQEFGPVFVDLGVVNERGIQVAYAGPFRLGKAIYADISIRMACNYCRICLPHSDFCLFLHSHRLTSNGKFVFWVHAFCK